MFIDGAVKDTGSLLPVLNPYDGSCVAFAADDGAADVDAAIESVARYDRSCPAHERAAVLRRAADALRARRDEIARLITRESGNCLRDSRSEIERAAANLEVAASLCGHMNGRAIPFGDAEQGRVAMTIREPVGVVCAITPFNRPLNQVVVKLAPAIAANNAVVLKPSEKTPLSALAFCEILIGCGLPPSMLAAVTGNPERLGFRLVSHDSVDMVTFTGSVSTGHRVAAQAAGRRITLELGGNDPLFVLRDADLDRAARIAARGAYGNAGQSCRGVKRILVESTVADEFAKCLLEVSLRIVAGDPLDPSTEIGTLIDARAAAEVAARCSEAVEDGARLLMGGRAQGARFPVTVLDRVDPRSRLVAQETFGPVAPILRIEDEHHGIEIANATGYGLQAGVVTEDFGRFQTICAGLRVGGVALQDGPNFDSPWIPFGGVRKSGVGREGIPFAMAEMTTVKTISLPWPGQTRERRRVSR